MTQKNYLCILRNENGGCEEPSPAQMEAMYAKFNAWQEKFKDRIVDMGGKLGDGGVLTPEGVIDGPFVEVKEIVGGFMIVSGANLEEAMEVVRETPGIAGSGASVEVREIHTS